MQNSPKINIANLLKTNSLRSGDLVYRMNLFGVIPVASATFKAEGGHLSAKVEPLKDSFIQHIFIFLKGSVKKRFPKHKKTKKIFDKSLFP